MGNGPSTKSGVTVGVGVGVAVAGAGVEVDVLVARAALMECITAGTAVAIGGRTADELEGRQLPLVAAGAVGRKEVVILLDDLAGAVPYPE